MFQAKFVWKASTGQYDVSNYCVPLLHYFFALRSERRKLASCDDPDGSSAPEDLSEMVVKKSGAQQKDVEWWYVSQSGTDQVKKHYCVGKQYSCTKEKEEEPAL